MGRTHVYELGSYDGSAGPNHFQTMIIIMGSDVGGPSFMGDIFSHRVLLSGTGTWDDDLLIVL